MNATVPDVSSLTLEQKLTLMDTLWDSIQAEQPVFPLPDWLKEDLRRQHEEFLRDPGRTVSWEESKARILDRHARTPNAARS
jgi:putative addiction module component (TIGR02574 family)